jgi:hypothetical protein
VLVHAAVKVVTDDLAQVVDAKCSGDAGAGGIVEDGVVESVSGHGGFRMDCHIYSMAPVPALSSGPPRATHRAKKLQR